MAHTPMMVQYLSIKEQYKDAFLLFRLGDFYEMFFEDAERASQLLEITLTSRAGDGENRIPMCGVPHHSAQGYIETLVSKGYKVAICEQVEDPKMTKGVVKREVVQLVTPGTITQGKALDGKTNHYLAATTQESAGYALAYLDVTTGEATAMMVDGDERALLNQLLAYNIKELVVADSLYHTLVEQAATMGIVLSIANERMADEQVAPFVIDVPLYMQQACALLLSYVMQTQMRALSHLQTFTYNEATNFLRIDTNSKRNLELIQSIRGGDTKGTLLWLVDETVTAMGGRKLKQWMHQPLASKRLIEQRQQFVGDFLDEFFVRAELQDLLKKVYDLERLAGRVAFGSVGGRDLAQLRDSLRQVPHIQHQLQQANSAVLQQFGANLDACADIEAFLASAITDQPPLTIKEGDVIRDGYNVRLDELRDASRNGKDWIAQLEQRERDITGVKNLKIGYNRIFGYYIELTKSHVQHADLTRYERKQTLANAERYITQELKEKEALILNAQEESLELEYQLFVEIRETMKGYIPRVQALAAQLSELDVYMSFAYIAEKYHFVKPTFHNGRAMHIINGRHPVVEKMLGKQTYVPNDCVLEEERNMYLITGPNMSGKSTYMRQVALIIVLAQMGSYVPADEAVLPITDQIFTRIGAADDVASGQSTFMVEMMESQHAIMHATKNSLMLFDEIGRGTSTYDGMSLAQAMMEYIHEEIGANTLFSTHYHELTALEDVLPRLTNVHVAAAEQDGKVVFLHKVKPGAADQSYGIHVAELAQLPQPILARARVLLTSFEAQSGDVQVIEKIVEKPVEVIVEKPVEVIVERVVEKPVVQDDAQQLSLFSEEGLTPQQKEALAQIEQCNVMNTTPFAALQLLNELQQLLRK
ncbi:DNA mismatch repair protein MutS [Caryophanon tenue]|uniref:DNA mismatch repair protein MutS n=1 Tax=Caryophanon tenue TaxID=33978 RepID=A0A1C0YKP2_9BACL|nr:DNA mismatch repair protein MutS [Caryophanon tenue]OCS87746.1 DNA mismatch repair protein MutS [Caryophanon tenue]